MWILFSFSKHRIWGCSVITGKVYVFWIIKIKSTLYVIIKQTKYLFKIDLSINYLWYNSQMYILSWIDEWNVAKIVLKIVPVTNLTWSTLQRRQKGKRCDHTLHICNITFTPDTLYQSSMEICIHSV